ncbi:MAG: FHA domain-containing protein [Thiotrichales bacterium]
MESLIIKHLSGSRSPRLESFPLEQLNELTLGRDATCDMVFEDEGVQPAHAKIVRDSDKHGKFWLHDLSSHKSLLVNDAFVSGYVSVRPGDRVRLGREGPILEVQIGEPQSPPTQNADRFSPRAPRLAPIARAMLWLFPIGILAAIAGVWFTQADLNSAAPAPAAPIADSNTALSTPATAVETALESAEAPLMPGVDEADANAAVDEHATFAAGLDSLAAETPTTPATEHLTSETTATTEITPVKADRRKSVEPLAEAFIGTIRVVPSEPAGAPAYEPTPIVEPAQDGWKVIKDM